MPETTAPAPGFDPVAYWTKALEDHPPFLSIAAIDRIIERSLKNLVYPASREGKLTLVKMFGRTGAFKDEWIRWLAANCAPIGSGRTGRLAAAGIATRTANRAARAAAATP